MSVTVDPTAASGGDRLPEPAETEAERIVPLRHPWRTVGVVIELLLLAMLIHAFVAQPGFQWGVVGHYLFARAVLDGVVMTIALTASAMGIGIALGLLMSILRMSDSLVLSAFARTYIAVFRAIPALVQMIFWFNMASLIPRLGLGVPFGPTFFQVNSSRIFSGFLAATLGLGLSEAAYMAEIFRGGMASVPAGQFEAARSIGMRRVMVLRYVVLPQAMKAVIPPTGNEVIGMLKYTSLASVIAVTELLESVTLIFDRTFQTVPLLIVAGIWYLVLTTVLTAGQRRIERYFGRGTLAEQSLARQVWNNATSLRRYRATTV